MHAYYIKKEQDKESISFESGLGGDVVCLKKLLTDRRTDGQTDIEHLAQVS